jgi:predicted nucleic acid-binding protein
VRLATDASALVAESLRVRGEQLIAHDDLDLCIAAPTWSEVVHEVGLRIDAQVRHGRIVIARREYMLRETLAMLSRNILVVAEAEYVQYEMEARDRIPQDPNDWPTVALGLSLDIGIWTSDRDFFGCGVPVWTTETLLTHLAAGRAGLGG